MKNRILNNLICLALTSLCISANAELSDQAFMARFRNYRAQHKISTLQTVQALATENKMKPEQVLKRYISAQWSSGSAGQREALMSGLEAYEQSGKTHAQALEFVSETVGQLTTTLEGMYKQVKIAQRVGPLPAVRQIASGKQQAALAKK